MGLQRGWSLEGLGRGLLLLVHELMVLQSRALAQSHQSRSPSCLAGRGKTIRAAKEPGAVETLFLLGDKRGIKFSFISSSLF